MLWIEVVMKLAGRKMWSSSVMPSAATAGLISASALSSSLVTSRVLARYWLDTMIMTPVLPLIAAAPMAGAGRVFHARDVFQANGDAVVVRDRGLAQIRGGLGLALGFEHDALGVVFDEARAAHAGGGARGIEHVSDGQIERGETVGQNLDLQLADFAAEDDGFGDAGHAEQTRTKGPIGEGADVHQRARVGGESDGEDHAGG